MIDCDHKPPPPRSSLNNFDRIFQYNTGRWEEGEKEGGGQFFFKTEKIITHFEILILFSVQ